jgi:two-component system, NarL family, response regulator NreC
MTIRILIADDHGVLRAGLRALLKAETDLEVVGEAGDGRDALRLAEQLHPDIVLMDLSMPAIGGIEATRRLRETQPDTHVLILTVHEDESLLREAIRAGASGYVVKRAAEAELMNAIRAVYQGDMYIHPAITRALMKDLSPQSTVNDQEAESLTERENDVLRLLARGYTNRQIGDTLGISVRTVEGHRSNLMGKLGLHSRVELVDYAERQGLLDMGKQKPG